MVLNGYGGNFDNEVCILYVSERERVCVRERRENVRGRREGVCVCVWKKECVNGREKK